MIAIEYLEVFLRNSMEDLFEEMTKIIKQANEKEANGNFTREGQINLLKSAVLEYKVKDFTINEIIAIARELSELLLTIKLILPVWEIWIPQIYNGEL